MVHTNDPERPKAPLTISVDVTVELDFEKSYIRFYKIKQGETKTESVRIMAKDIASLKLGKPTVKGEGFRAKIVKERGKDGKPAYRLEAEFKAEKVGNSSGTITVSTNHPKHKELKLHVSAKVDGDIAATPNRLTIQKGKDKEKLGVIRVHSQKTKFKIKEVATRQQLLTTKLTTEKKGKAYVIEVALSEKGKKLNRAISDSLIIKTDSKKQPELKVPVYLRKSGKGRSFRDSKKINPNVKLKKLKVK